METLPTDPLDPVLSGRGAGRGQRLAGRVLLVTGFFASLGAALFWCGALVAAVLLPVSEEPFGWLVLPAFLLPAVVFVLIGKCSWQFGARFGQVTPGETGSQFLRSLTVQLCGELTWIVGLPLLVGGLFLAIAGQTTVGLVLLVITFGILAALDRLAKSHGSGE